MKISFSLLSDVEDLYEDFFKPLGISKQQYKRAGFKKGLRFSAKKTLDVSCDLLRKGEVSPIYNGQPLSILHEDENFLAVSKTCHQHGHGHSFSESDTAQSFLRSVNKLPEVEGVDRGMLYRLDKETSGVLVFAKKAEIYEEMRESFASLAREKVYLAIVEGKFEEPGIKKHLLKSVGAKGERQVESEEGVEAVLEVTKTSYNEADNLSLLEIDLTTGLRHQIRAQLSILGFPIHGDELYGGRKAERVYLHALKYAFDWEGKRIVFFDDSVFLFDKFFDLNSSF